MVKVVHSKENIQAFGGLNFVAVHYDKKGNCKIVRKLNFTYKMNFKKDFLNSLKLLPYINISHLIKHGFSTNQSGC